MIKLENISKKYDKFFAVQNINVNFSKGKIIGLLGQNGAGKSTILNMITGYIGPSSGKITINGYDIFKKSKEAKRMIGYLPEQPPLYDEMTVEEYLRFCCKLKGVKKNETNAHIKEISETTDIESIMGKLIGHLSKGYRQRLGIAQALCGNPQILIFDEPTIGLDPKQLLQVRKLIASLGEKRTIILSSHVLPEVQNLCEQVYIIHKGEIIKKVFTKNLTKEDKKTVLLQADIAMAPEELLPCLQGLSSVKRVFSYSENGEEVTKVTLECKAWLEPERQLFVLLSGIGAPLLRLMAKEDSLEEVFLRATATAEKKENENKQ